MVLLNHSGSGFSWKGEEMKRREKWIAFLLILILIVSLIPEAAYAASGDTIVFRTKTGKSYHTENCSSLKKSSFEVTLLEAVNMGLTPCSKCHPPTFDVTSESEPSRGVSSSDIPASSVFVDGTRFEVVITATNTVVNSKVGHNWIFKFCIDDYVINTEDIVAFNQNDILTIHTEITENDKIPDISDEKTIYTVTKKDLSDGFTVTHNIEVEENAGRYARSTTEWTVVYTFTRCD